MPPRQERVPLETRSFPDISKLVESKANRRKRFLPVELAGKRCLLKMERVGPADHREWIAYYDPTIPKQRDAGAVEVAKRLKYLNTDLIITPSSGKSEIMVALAAQNAGGKKRKKPAVLTLKKGIPGSKEMKPYEKTAAYKALYIPITSGGKNRELIVTNTDREIIVANIRTGRNITVVDDVYSTGETIRAIDTVFREIYRYATGKSLKNKLNVVTIMRECSKNETTGELDISNVTNVNLYTAIITPVIKGRLPPRVKKKR